ncbi:aspartyl-phosphate phosphatase Spo0E family protein [Oceanobacillus alkalisoli]|nr:aspartyl-phosphate phosphatase Spo0E family protein [Oceanobacillus alkalisoli]MCF3943974.1 aspartyl-phosphate phosphatase Spo0E family protein [Oceanobacillus alkalisoli]MCG5103246.1 aspartyl-phosphate phosphatase Spo0E family protein [Oceanobacillus alkalisoli]
MVQIEKKRLKMYEAYTNNATYEKLINISQELDQLLNQLATLNQKRKQEK